MRNSRDATPVLIACEDGRLELVKILAEGGADVGVKDDNFHTPLFVASRDGHRDVVGYLLQLGCVDVDDGVYFGMSPLAAACAEGHMDVVKLLVEEGGADVDLEGKYRNGPLYHACRGGFGTMVALLVKKGAWSRASKDEDGGVWVRGLSVAARCGHVDVVRMLVGGGSGGGWSGYEWKHTIESCQLEWTCESCGG